MYPKQFTKILTNSNNFTDFMEEMKTIDDKVTIGKYFEYFAKLLLLCDNRFQYVKECWLLDELPQKLHEKLCIPEQDIGIDLVVKTTDDEYFAVQAKYRKNINYVIRWDVISTFFGLTFGLSGKFVKGIFFTNTLEPNKHIIGKANTILIMYR